jgi:hypothetical protein
MAHQSSHVSARAGTSILAREDYGVTWWLPRLLRSASAWSFRPTSAATWSFSRSPHWPSRSSRTSTLWWSLTVPVTLCGCGTRPRAPVPVHPSSGRTAAWRPARNRGAAEATGELLLFLDDDMEGRSIAPPGSRPCPHARRRRGDRQRPAARRLPGQLLQRGCRNLRRAASGGARHGSATGSVW